MSGTELTFSFARARDAGVELRIRLIPHARAEALGGLAADARGQACLAARVRAVAEKGEANRALARLLSHRLHVPQSSVKILSGTTSRHKKVLIEGDAKALLARIAELACRR